MKLLTGKSVLARIAYITKGTWVSGATSKYLGAWDENLCIPTEADLRDIGKYTDGFFRIANVAYVTEAFDCEDISLLFMALARLRAFSSGTKTSICMGIAYGEFNWRVGAHCTNWTIIERPDGSIEPCWLEPQDLLGDADIVSTLRPISTKAHKMLRVMIV